MFILSFALLAVAASAASVCKCVSAREKVYLKCDSRLFGVFFINEFVRLKGANGFEIKKCMAANVANPASGGFYYEAGSFLFTWASQRESPRLKMPFVTFFSFPSSVTNRRLGRKTHACLPN